MKVGDKVKIEYPELTLFHGQEVVVEDTLPERATKRKVEKIGLKLARFLGPLFAFRNHHGHSTWLPQENARVVR